MKSKYWILIVTVVLVLCLGLTLVLMGGKPATRVEIRIGDTRYTLDLSEDQEFTLQPLDGGYNTVTIRDGKIAVTAADCPDQYCVNRGFCSGGVPIVCLPHGLVIEFLGDQEIDGLLG